ncbi:MAG: hypothetical protein EOO38_05040 [Cytophagaceae bacterium]|nr:MAG: hypothetical protein EOO38_05040 [Cytophagaceae bacterium]
MNGVTTYLYSNLLEVPAWFCFIVAALLAAWSLAEAIFYGVYRIRVFRGFMASTALGVSILMILSGTSWMEACGIGIALFVLVAFVVLMASDRGDTYRRIKI